MHVVNVLSYSADNVCVFSFQLLKGGHTYSLSELGVLPLSHLTSLQGSSLRQTPGPFHSGVEMEVDDRAVASPTQGLLSLRVMIYYFP